MLSVVIVEVVPSCKLVGAFAGVVIGMGIGPFSPRRLCDPYGFAIGSGRLGLVKTWRMPRSVSASWKGMERWGRCLQSGAESKCPVRKTGQGPPSEACRRAFLIVAEHLRVGQSPVAVDGRMQLFSAPGWRRSLLLSVMQMPGSSRSVPVSGYADAAWPLAAHH